MRRVRGKDTSPELAVRRALWAAGFRYRLHLKSLPGKPDIVFARRRITVFVHGCFWHQHQGCSRSKRPATRRQYWDAKLDRNMERDDLTRRRLQDLGWQVVTLWECDLSEGVDRLLKLLKV